MRVNIFAAFCAIPVLFIYATWTLYDSLKLFSEEDRLELSGITKGILKIFGLFVLTSIFLLEHGPSLLLGTTFLYSFFVIWYIQKEIRRRDLPAYFQDKALISSVLICLSILTSLVVVPRVLRFYGIIDR